MMAQLIRAMESGQLPDSAIRFGIRKLCQSRLEELKAPNLETQELRRQEYRDSLIRSPLAVHTHSANQQHYEVPAQFYLHTLGKNLKYSSCYWAPETRTLEQAEELALEISVKRAQISDGMRILELGCGWGSLTLYLAKTFPSSQIVAVSNSASQKEHIDTEASKRGLKNILVLTRDVSKLESLALEFPSFDRVMSIEMFEHFKNYQLLLSKISDVLSPTGKLFVHIFTHKDHSYPFETEGEDNWMGKYFFTGGQMPAHHLLASFQQHLRLETTWVWDGVHYQKTAEAWLERMDQNRSQIMDIFQGTYGKDHKVWFQRWRVFFMACAELFGYENGTQWAVSHYLFTKET